jgi:anion-transporting  ArsA/GET3 family ATPase
MAAGFAGLDDDHRVVVCVGSGGVGKTTTAAALAVSAAMHGKRVLCLTIDPAWRLANSLGLTEMRTREQEVPPTLFALHGLPCTGSLSAMMLDTKRTFDELVVQYASSPEARDRILENKLYQYVSSSLAGTREYMAMEKLHAVRQDTQWDLIVLDTPPTTNALDFLEAPQRLVGLIDSAAVRWFMQAFEGAGKLSLGLVSRGAAFLLRGLSRFTGVAFLEQVAEFVTDLNDLFGGFRERAQQVAEALRSPDVAFVLVTSPNPLAMAEAIYFHKQLSAMGIEPRGFVVNGVHPLHPEPEATTATLEAEAKDVLPEGTDVRRAVQRLRRALDDARMLAGTDRALVGRLRARAGDRGTLVEVPAFDEDIHDLSGLAKMAEHLTLSSDQGA